MCFIGLTWQPDRVSIRSGRNWRWLFLVFLVFVFLVLQDYSKLLCKFFYTIVIEVFFKII